MGLFRKSQAPEPDLRLDALRAEFQNYRRRTTEQLEVSEQQSTKKTVLAFLPIYDDLARALACPCQDAAYYHGIELLMQKLLATLEGFKVQPMQSVGKCFNPDYHEAVEHITDENYREEEIVSVVLTGFTMDEEVIRHAKVVVAN